MRSPIKERRNCKKFLPYIFFSLEIVLYGEIAFMLVLVFENSLYATITAAAFFIFQIYNATKRLQKVLQRCKLAKTMKKHI